MCRDRLREVLSQRKAAALEGDESAQPGDEVGGTLTSEPIDDDGDVHPPRRPTLEEVEDVDAPSRSQRYVEPFPRPVATPIRTSKEKTKFETLLENQTKAKKDQWSPFASQEEWDLAVWLMKNVGQKSTDEFLKLRATRDRMNLSFQNNRAFLKKVDALPAGPQWECEIITAPGDQVGEDGEIVGEEMELWYRNPIECIQELVGNPAFSNSTSFVPERVYTSSDGDERIYDEMWTGDWWWNTQGKLPDGAAIAPLILSSDKTQLSQFQGDKKAWPVYLTIGNISKEVRRSPSTHATLLLGYLPIPKLNCYSDATRSLASYRLFHHCMSRILEPLVEAGQRGVEMVCADGFVRLIHPILAAYVADYPEQCLVSCCMENRCPRCTVDPKERGDFIQSPDRNVASTLHILGEHKNDYNPQRFSDDGIRAIYEPFWRNLPYCNIFECFTPDLLHQLHKGLFKDHIVKWCTALVGETELDARFKAMSGYPGLRHFSKGISFVSQWTGTEHREMQRIFLGVLAGSAVDKRVVTVVRAALDFIYYAQLQMHTSTTLAALKSCLATFHHYKDIFIQLEIRKHFNIPKIHCLLHYFASIQALGSNDGYNSESPERLHIDFAKDAFRASNRKDYHEQMALWLQRREAMWQREAYIKWLTDQQGARGQYYDLDSELTGGEPNGPAVHGGMSIGATSIQKYHIAKKPSFRGVSVEFLSTHFGVKNLIPALTTFLSQHWQSHPILPNMFDCFDLYKQIIITLPPNAFLSSRPITNRIRTTPAVPPSGRRPGSPAVFDTALIINDLIEHRSHGGLAGLRVAQIRIIFLLPSQFGTHPHPLAYVEWFTPLGTPDPLTGMYTINRSTRHHCPNSAVISVHHICGASIAKKGWTTDTVIEKGKEFYLNPYIHVDTFTAINIK
ncbi:hypothetical protein BD779DRAFT_1613422 [Infundibulicybe gibba]|nr:hypothetical protein BD779DRAFT_1613422 [Infundibulicybe gibba]